MSYIEIGRLALQLRFTHLVYSSCPKFVYYTKTFIIGFQNYILSAQLKIIKAEFRIKLIYEPFQILL